MRKLKRIHKRSVSKIHLSKSLLSKLAAEANYVLKKYSGLPLEVINYER